MKKVLVIAAHPDDEVLGMGGTIAKLVKSGCVVDVMIVTDGSSSQYRDSDRLDEIISAKKKETRNCAVILGVRDIYYGELPDMRYEEVFPDPRCVHLLRGLTAALRPSLTSPLLPPQPLLP